MSASFCVSDQQHYKNPNFHNHCLKGIIRAGLWECMSGYCYLSAQKVESMYTSWKIENSFITSFLADVFFCLYSVPLCHLILPFNNRKLFSNNIIKYLIIVKYIIIFNLLNIKYLILFLRVWLGPAYPVYFDHVHNMGWGLPMREKHEGCVVLSWLTTFNIRLYRVTRFFSSRFQFSLQPSKSPLCILACFYYLSFGGYLGRFLFLCLSSFFPWWIEQ